jgi:hypothetical protein
MIVGVIASGRSSYCMRLDGSIKNEFDSPAILPFYLVSLPRQFWLARGEGLLVLVTNSTSQLNERYDRPPLIARIVLVLSVSSVQHEVFNISSKGINEVGGVSL